MIWSNLGRRLVAQPNAATVKTLLGISSGSGDVVGPASSTNNGFVKFDGTTGKLVKDSAASITAAEVSDFSTAADARVSAAIGSTVQAYDTDLASWAGVTRASGFDTFAATPSSANLRALLSDETGTGIAYFVGGALGTPSSATLTNATGLPVSGVTPSTSTALGVGSIELGHASDTTLARSSAGNVSVEGNLLYRAGGTDVAVADGGTNISSYTTGDILYASGATTLSKLAIGTSGYALKSTGSAIVWSPSREILTGDRTYYVRTDGSDSNNGLANTSGGAFLTIQKAIDTCLSIDMASYNTTIQVGNGTYSAGVSLSARFLGGTVTLKGDTTTPSNVVISTSSGSVISISNSTITIGGFKVESSGGGRLLDLSDMAFVTLLAMEYGATTNRQISATRNCTITANNAYTISGGGSNHIYCGLNSSVINISKTITVTGTPAFSNAFIFAEVGGGLSCGGLTFSGSATGKRYNITSNASVTTSGGGASYFPGNVAGTTSADGEYT